MGVGVLTMIVTLSVMSGFEDELKKRLFSAETHVLVESNDGFFKADPDLVKTISAVSPLVEQVYPVLQTEVILRSGKKVNGSVLKGVGDDQLEWLKRKVVEWSAKDLLAEADNAGTAHLFLGAEMAYDMGVIPGDLVTVVSPVESEGPFGAIPRVKKFVVEGIYKSGVPEQELHTIFAGSKDVEAFLKQTAVLSQVEVRVKRLEDAPKVAELLASVLPQKFLVRPWQVLDAHLFQSLRLERTAMFCILIFIVIVASFNIVSTLTMMVLEKKRSLSILRAMGATRSQIGSIFIWEGLAIAIFGIAGGAAVGLGICELLANYPIIELPEYYYDRTLPVVVQPASIAIICGAAFVVVLLGALKPARKASEIMPIQGIREG
ncbi:MAG: ABC transporter permease [Deltaproteobacteria bacterium]|nr:ABC transporter permease [Deltaproteobacteria bacterium]